MPRPPRLLKQAKQPSAASVPPAGQRVNDYAIFMLDPNGTVASWNSGAECIKGYAADEIIRQHFSQFHTATDEVPIHRVLHVIRLRSLTPFGFQP